MLLEVVFIGMLTAADDFHAWKDGTITELHAQPCASKDLTDWIMTNWRSEARRAVNVDTAGVRTEGCYAKTLGEGGEEFLGVVDEKDRVRMVFTYPS